MVAGRHYCLPPLKRLAADGLRHIHGWRYLLLHAPRQTGKTSGLLALRDLLNSGRVGDFCAVQVNFEVGQAAREDTRRAMRAILDAMAKRALALGDGFLDSIRDEALERSGPDAALSRALTEWSLADEMPLVLLVDEVDALVGDTLILVLRQLREGYELRPRAFPQSIVLGELRDVEHYRTEWEEKAGLAAGSPFNIIARSPRLGNFSRAEVEALLGQHTAETGQESCRRRRSSSGRRPAGSPGW